jgi:ubiquinone/menaquinone biosynthesis C-methylase UbiE
VRVVGIDRSERQVSLASSRAVARRLHNCRFEHADVRALPWRDGTVDAVVASRLFTIVAERERVIGEMHRVLRPGGRCFIAEPCSAIRTAMPLGALWMLAGVTSLFQGQPMSYCEPRRPVVLAANSFGRLVESQPWGRVWRWQDSQYHYAICEKGVTSIDVPPRLGNPFQPGITL